MTIRLSGQQRKELAAALKADIDGFCVQTYSGGHREHLGASLIGEKCARKLWYIFRWMHKEQFDGQKLRLFNRGHREEERIIEWLRGIDGEVYAASEDGTQFRISAVGGHFGGSLDGVVKLPTRYNLPGPMLCEFKTHNERNFKKLVKDGVRLSHPKHFDQMSTYGAVYELQYALYFAICKNDDNIHIEIVDLDHALGRRNIQKANDIILSPTAPGRIAASPAFADCAYCSMCGICHRGDSVDRNCRSCAFASPIDGGWHCSKWDLMLTQSAIIAGCDAWQELNHD